MIILLYSHINEMIDINNQTFFDQLFSLTNYTYFVFSYSMDGIMTLSI